MTHFLPRVMEFSNKVVLITGASKGIGRATALAFAEHGCLLSLTGRNQDDLDSVSSLCKSKGAKEVMAIQAEFENMEEVESVVPKTIEKFKTIDVLVNNAGLNLLGNLETLKMEDFDCIFKVNVKSMVRITQQAMHYLLQTKGNVVNVSSYLAEKQFPPTMLYCMTKAAVNQFTKTAALEYAPQGVRVNALCPYAVRTRISRHKYKTDEEFDEYYERCKDSIPCGRIGKVEECANAILFLASNQSAWTTGQCLVIDGGKSLA